MTSLVVGATVAGPLTIASEHLAGHVVLGGNRARALGVVLGEEWLLAKRQVIILDGHGSWSGLRRRHQEPDLAFLIPITGTDVDGLALEATDGGPLAEVLSGGASCVITIAHLPAHRRGRFLIDFAMRLRGQPDSVRAVVIDDSEPRPDDEMTVRRMQLLLRDHVDLVSIRTDDDSALATLSQANTVMINGDRGSILQAAIADWCQRQHVPWAATDDALAHGVAHSLATGPFLVRPPITLAGSLPLPSLPALPASMLSECTWLKRGLLRLRRQNVRDMERRIGAMHQQRFSVSRIAEAVNRAHSYVRRVLNGQGIDPQVARRKDSEQRVREALPSCTSVLQVAQALQIPRMTASLWLHRLDPVLVKHWEWRNDQHRRQETARRQAGAAVLRQIIHVRQLPIGDLAAQAGQKRSTFCESSLKGRSGFDQAASALAPILGVSLDDLHALPTALSSWDQATNDISEASESVGKMLSESAASERLAC